MLQLIVQRGFLRSCIRTHSVFEPGHLPIWHIYNFNILLPQRQQLKYTLQSLLKSNNSQRDIFPDFLLTDAQQLRIFFLQLFKHAILIFLRESTLNWLNKQTSFTNVLSQDLKLWGKTHMSDLRLDISKEWLQQFILLINCLLVIKKLLHCFVITLFRINSQFLQFLLVFSKVKNRLWQYQISINLLIQGA
jgi:hypothetical protein